MTERDAVTPEVPGVYTFLEFDRALHYTLPPDMAGWFVHANRCLTARQFGDAERLFRVVLQRVPDCAFAHYLLGITLRYANSLDLALHHASEAARLAPDSLEAQLGLRNALLELHRMEEALAVTTEAVRRWPDSPRAHMCRGHSLLVLGRLAEGFREGEWRLQSGPYCWRHPEATRWDGGPLRGQTVLLYSDGGFADTLQFVRYVPLVAARGGRVVLQVPPELVRLLDGFPETTVINIGDLAPPPFDVHAALGSLPALFKTDLGSIPAAVPYLRPPFEAAMAPTAHDGLRVGIVWAGSVNTPSDHRRSTRLTDWKCVLEVPGVTFVSLQVGAPAGQLAEVPSPILNAAVWFRDFADTATLLRHLDLVVTVDSAVAHLSGAMGLTTWMLVARSQDARWLLHREDSPWYPTMRLFRQQTFGDWAEVLRRVAEELAAWVGDHSAVNVSQEGVP